jgi:hypothetical protein
MPKPPKSDAIGKETLWESFTKNNTFEILTRTKKIAILPASASYYARKINPDQLQKSQSALNAVSGELQKLYFSMLYNKKLSAVLQNPEETNRILGDRNMLTIEMLNKTPKNTLCFLLGVDAIMYIDMTVENLKSQLAEAALSMISLDTPSEELAIGLRMYEKANGEFFWAYQASEKRNSKETASAAFSKLVMGSIKDIPFLIK